MAADTLTILRRTAFLYGLPEETLRAIAARLTAEDFAPGSVIYAQGSRPAGVYLLVSGKVDLVRAQAGGRKRAPERRIGSLTAGDWLGEAEVLYRSPRSASARARDAVRLLRWEKADLAGFLGAHPSALRRLKLQADTRRMAQALSLDWLAEDETVYLLTRRHPFFLLRGMALPAASLALSAAIWFGPWGTVATGGLLAGLALAVGLAWGAWAALDWSNDFYLLTNRRAIWLERIVGLYDSRRETPLAMVLSVDRTTDVLGRWLGYGDVIVRTYTGQLVLRGVADPYALAKLVEEHWKRLQEAQSHADRAEMDAALQRALRPEAQPAAREAEAPAGPPPPASVGMDHWTFQVRFEQAGVITYRKHWAVLLGQLAAPSTLLLLVVGLLGAQLGGLTGSLPIGTPLGLAAMVLVPLAGWWVYRYVDWANDLYQITPDHIVDVRRTPLGREVRKVAPLENILGTEVDRKGILGLLLNFGDVLANVGSAQLIFRGVYDPNGVQQDIVRALEAFLERKRRAQQRQRQDEIVEWLSSYHQQAGGRPATPDRTGDA